MKKLQRFAMRSIGERNRINYMKLLNLFFCVLMLTSVLGCSKDDAEQMPCQADQNGISQGTSSFTFKSENFSCYDQCGSLQIFNHIDDGISDGTVTIVGTRSEGNQLVTVSISFRLFWNTADGISDTYTISDSDANDTYLDHLSIYLESWSDTQGNVQQQYTSNNPQSSIVFTHLGGQSYNLNFDVTYIDGTTASGNVTCDLIVQEGDF